LGDERIGAEETSRVLREALIPSGALDDDDTDMT
jgi:hypothetical protein